MEVAVHNRCLSKFFMVHIRNRAEQSITAGINRCIYKRPDANPPALNECQV